MSTDPQSTASDVAVTGPPLGGVRVIELGAWVAGPAAGAILADWGADVIKVEPLAGDHAMPVDIGPQRRLEQSRVFSTFC